MIFIFFILNKIIWTTKKIFEKIRWKRWRKTSFAQNKLNFTWKESTNYKKKKNGWGGLCLIEINPLLINSWINCFTKTKNIRDKIQ